MHHVLGRNLNIFFSEFFNESGYGLFGLDWIGLRVIRFCFE